MGFAGTEGGKWFGSPHPRWVDRSLPPGYTPLKLPQGFWGRLKPIITTEVLFYTPNFVWFIITLGAYVMFPYDFDSAKTWNLSWILDRAALNLTITVTFVGFWYMSLYHAHWAERKFQEKQPSLGMMIHNIWYTCLGALQWTAWEVVFMHAFANGYLPYISDKDSFSSPGNILRMIGYTILIPVWREFHFYWAHRMLHMRVLYKYVHSLHHRNIDPEPFSGLAMHPVEHLYYFSTIAPSLYLLMSPFHFMWNGMHAVISPAAAHSGWEDHWQSDQLHYLHHARFECNYGGGGLAMDKIFGTYREKMGNSHEYKGAANGKDDEKLKAEKTTVTRVALDIRNAIPKLEDFVYTLLYLGCFALFFLALIPLPWLQGLHIAGFNVIGLVLAYGPIVAAFCMRGLFPDRLSVIWPFHKESVVGPLGLHIIVGSLFTTIPVYHAAVIAFGQ
eukprot:m.56557 g.56557  ORF g.56557 m.56557 type:complete len:445 (-) comp11044_c0_seq2:97-1431(-)